MVKWEEMIPYSPPLSSFFPSLSLDSPPVSLEPFPRVVTRSAFERLPPELIEHIALHLARLSPVGPPTTLLPLLSVSRRIYDVLGPANDGFYGQVYKERFNWRSSERRWSRMKSIEDRREKKQLLEDCLEDGVRPDEDLKLTYGSFTRPNSPSELPVSKSIWRPLTSHDYAAELRRRSVVLTKIRAASRAGAIPPQVSRPSSPKLPAMTAIGTFQSALDEPDDNTQNLWTIYLMLIENDGKNLEHLIKYADVKTYTRLFYRSSLLSDAMKPGWPKRTPGRGLGLWMGWLAGDDLATETTRESDEQFFVLKPYVFGAHKFDCFYAPWTIKQLPVSARGATTAPPPRDDFTADLRPHVQAQSIMHMGRRLPLAPPVLAHAAIFSFFYRIEQDPEGSEGQVLTAPPQFAAFGGFASSLPTVKPAKTARPTLASAIHDRDFVRLASCVDPYSSLGLPTLFSRGTIAGSWEGRFSFFDFDSYRDMLGGRMRQLYEGPFGDQPQVWKLEEKIVRRPRSEHGGTGPVLNAGYEIGDHGPRASSSSTTISTSPPPPAPLRSERLEATGSNDSLPLRSRRKSIDGPGELPEVRSAKRPRSIPEEFQQEEDDDDDDGDFEILLTGSGHSAWGQFVLKGRVRAYDGLFSITKEYSFDRIGGETRGRWLYRGYHVGVNLVGRWRDTHTPDDMNGYEGNFLMTRRA